MDEKVKCGYAEVEEHAHTQANKERQRDRKTKGRERDWRMERTAKKQASKGRKETYARQQPTASSDSQQTTRYACQTNWFKARQCLLCIMTTRTPDTTTASTRHLKTSR